MISQDTEIDDSHVKYPAVKEAFTEFGANLSQNTDTSLIMWWDGDIHKQHFDQVKSSQRISKIPDLQREHAKLQARSQKPVTWIVKPRNQCCGHGIRLIQHIYELQNKVEPIVVQRYISPFLLDGFKFDFRFYILISSLAPYTIYIYKEGLARFCTKQYSNPTAGTLNDRFATLTNTSVNVENTEASTDFTRLASTTIEQIIAADPARGPFLWDKICDVSLMTMLAIWPQIVSSISQFQLERRYLPPTSELVLDAYSKYFHIIGIDIMVNEFCAPVLLEINDRPSMVVTFDCEKDLKKNLILDALSCLTVDGSPADPAKQSPNFQILLPVTDPTSAIGQQANHIISQTANIFRTASANRERPHFEERPKEKEKIKKSKFTFADLPVDSECQ